MTDLQAQARESAPVEQCDRDAALVYLQKQSFEQKSERFQAEMLAGERDVSMTVQAFARHRIAALQSRADEGLETRIRRNLNGWAVWHGLATADDDNEYLNSQGWADAEALADNTKTLLAALNRTGGE